MKADLSVVIPHHNHAAELPRLLESLRAQEMENLEVIVVDDLSPTSCEHVIRDFAARGLNVRLLQSEERVFTKDARLMGVREAQADIIAFADCDDEFINPPSLREHVGRFIAAGADVLHFHTVTLDGAGSYLTNVRLGAPLADCLNDGEIFARFVALDRGYPVWGKLYARELCLRVASLAWDIPIRRYTEDFLLSTLLLFHARRYVGGDRTGYRHYYMDKRDIDAAERAAYKYVMLTRVLPHLAANGCPEPVLRDFARQLRKKLCLSAGRFCKTACANGDFLSEDQLDALLELADARTWLKIFALGNGMNAEKLVRMTRTALDVE
ncbi:MAG: glycosyltransferase [Desulfovibrio sp.]|jgi:glycosyltransferase involved in cell wall biosynthesis|nr:glycosyltransferase [Desulfovibrio sp.]